MKNILVILLMMLTLIQYDSVAKARINNNGKAKKYSEMALVRGGVYKPLFSASKGDTLRKVKSFLMDKCPVTNEEFLSFVKANPKWARSNVKRLFAEPTYLRTWKNDYELGESLEPKSPVTNISWFAAKAYSEWKGKRLPTIVEWEYAAMASKNKPNGYNDQKMNKKILDWFSKPSSPNLPKIMLSDKNYWGIYDMHCLIWEWTYDFNSSFTSADRGQNSSASQSFFCGAGSLGARDNRNYPAFMRFAFRSSLKANYCCGDLGFRCARDLD